LKFSEEIFQDSIDSTFKRISFSIFLLQKAFSQRKNLRGSLNLSIAFVSSMEALDFVDF